MLGGDDPYYYEDGTAFRLNTASRTAASADSSNTSQSTRPVRGTMLTGIRGARLMPRREQMGHDLDMPVITKADRLQAMYEHLPTHIVHSIVYDAPELTLDELAARLDAVTPEQIAAPRELAPAPTSAPPLPDLEAREAGVEAEEAPTPTRKGRRTGRIQGGAGPGGGRGQRKSVKKYQAPPKGTEVVHFVQPAAVSLMSCEELQPGLLLIQGMMDLKTQQWVADEAFRLGDTPGGKTGGFYRVYPDGRIGLNQHHRGNFGEDLGSFAPHFRELCLHYFRHARTRSANITDTAAQWCAFNLYPEDSKGIAWHVDGDESPENLRNGTGRTVVSFSLGCDCDFRWKNRSHEDDRVVRLRSGDVLLFGGPSRGILHSVTKIHPGTQPPGLRMRKGRLNLTFRHGLTKRYLDSTA